MYTIIIIVVYLCISIFRIFVRILISALHEMVDGLVLIINTALIYFKLYQKRCVLVILKLMIVCIKLSLI